MLIRILGIAVFAVLMLGNRRRKNNHSRYAQHNEYGGKLYRLPRKIS